jgi:hypothetical protein
MEPGLIDSGTPETVGYLRSLKNVCWALSFSIACGLVVLVKWHAEIQDYAAAHRGIALYVLLGLFLAIPARIVGLIAAYWLELLFVGWERSSIKLLWKPQASVRLDIISIFLTLLLPHRRLGYLLSFGLLYGIDVYAAHHTLPSVTQLLPIWALQALLFLVVQSMVRYWLHRMEHVVPALWALHKFRCAPRSWQPVLCHLGDLGHLPDVHCDQRLSGTFQSHHGLRVDRTLVDCVAEDAPPAPCQVPRVSRQEL